MLVGPKPEQKVFDEAVHPGRLVERVSWMAGAIDEQAVERQKLRETGRRGHYTEANGFWPAMNGQHVARINCAIRAAINAVDPEILTDSRKLMWWLTNTEMGRLCRVDK